MRKNPYQWLLEIARQFAFDVLNPRKTFMFRFSAEKINNREAWRLDELAERVKAADQLGYNVNLVWSDRDGLQVYYTERPKIPCQLD